MLLVAHIMPKQYQHGEDALLPRRCSRPNTLVASDCGKLRQPRRAGRSLEALTSGRSLPGSFALLIYGSPARLRAAV